MKNSIFTLTNGDRRKSPPRNAAGSGAVGCPAPLWRCCASQRSLPGNSFAAVLASACGRICASASACSGAIRASPILAILCLTLGIGANHRGVQLDRRSPAASVSRGRPPGANDGHRRNLRGVAGAPGDSTDLSWPDFQDFQRNCTLFDAFIVDRITGVTLAIGDRAESPDGSIVSANYFDAPWESVPSWGAASNPPKISAATLIP